MAVVDVVEVVSDRALSGGFRTPFTYSRSFLVKLDTPATSILEVAKAPVIAYFDAHPDDATCVMQDFDCKVADETGLYYSVTFKYQPIPPGEGGDFGSGSVQNPLAFPGDYWAAAASVTTGPVTEDKDGKPVLNAAGHPIPDLEMDHAEFRLTLTRCFADLSWAAAAQQYTNAVNAQGWMGSDPRTWKCHFQNAAKRAESNDAGELRYWETTWEFVYRAETWDIRPLDVGLQEKGGKAIKVNGEPVAAPVAIGPDGKGRPDEEPNVIRGGNGARVYREEDFSVFGTLS
jgi:hypothetical protein